MRCRIKRKYDPGRGRTVLGGGRCSINVRSLRDRRQRQLLDIGPHRAEARDAMPNASQRYSADTIISNRAALGDAAFVGFSRTLNGQTPSRESQYRMPDPMLHRSNYLKAVNDTPKGLDPYFQNSVELPAKARASEIISRLKRDFGGRTRPCGASDGGARKK